MMIIVLCGLHVQCRSSCRQHLTLVERTRWTDRDSAPKTYSADRLVSFCAVFCYQTTYTSNCLLWSKVFGWVIVRVANLQNVSLQQFPVLTTGLILIGHQSSELVRQKLCVWWLWLWCAEWMNMCFNQKLEW